MLNNHSYRTDRAELYCNVQIYNHLTHNCHMVIIRLPLDYMGMQDIEKYVKKQVETVYISYIKIIGIGTTVLGNCTTDA